MEEPKIEAKKEGGYAWLLDKNGKFRSTVNLIANGLFLILIVIFFIDYDAAKNSYTFNRVMDGIKDCQNYSHVYLVLGHSNLDSYLNASPLILGYTCTNDVIGTKTILQYDPLSQQANLTNALNPPKPTTEKIKSGDQ